MRKNRMIKNFLTLSVMCALLFANTNAMFVSAQETEKEGIIFLDKIEDMERYNGADGTYAAFLEDGSCIKVIIKTTDVANSGVSTYATGYIQNKSYNYIVEKPNGELDWRSEVVGTFHYNNTYVWCTAGIAYSEFGNPSRSSISYSSNTYSSTKVTGVSKYSIKAKIVTPTGTYNISQYIGCNPAGEASWGMSR